jgi:hypothetical protein
VAVLLQLIWDRLPRPSRERGAARQNQSVPETPICSRQGGNQWPKAAVKTDGGNKK